MQHRKFKPINLSNYREISLIKEYLSEEQLFDIEIVGSVLPFRTNEYVVEELIDWKAVPNDPVFILMFPQRDMLSEEHYDAMATLIKSGARPELIAAKANEIRDTLNPHPAGQLEHNVPMLGEEKLLGIQHKYDQTMLFFPQQGQTCHAHCTFCFRWPQFIGNNELKFAMKDADKMISYLKEHPEITDVLFTGGDPLIMPTKVLSTYIDALLLADIPHLKTIRIGSKVLTFWPQRFVSDKDANELLALFQRVADSGKHLALMAHFNHYQEMQTDTVREAIKQIRATGTQIRTQSPLLRGINDTPEVWSIMWREQVQLGLVPYYMFIARDTGAQEYFAVTLERAWEIFRDAYQEVSGVARTVRGPSMSTDPGKVQVVGVSEIQEEKVFILNFIQGREKEWAQRPFFAKYDAEAIWFNELEPAFNEKTFFFENELEEMFNH